MTEEEFDEKYLESILKRNPHLVTSLRIHPWRWRLLAIWIAAFTLIAFALVRENRQQISDLRDTKASVISLQNTNCALYSFLLTAAVARQNAADHDKSIVQREVDLRAAHSYEKLARSFHCNRGQNNGH